MQRDNFGSLKKIEGKDRLRIEDLVLGMETLPLFGATVCQKVYEEMLPYFMSKYTFEALKPYHEMYANALGKWYKN